MLDYFHKVFLNHLGKNIINPTALDQHFLFLWSERPTDCHIPAARTFFLPWQNERVNLNWTQWWIYAVISSHQFQQQSVRIFCFLDCPGVGALLFKINSPFLTLWEMMTTTTKYWVAGHAGATMGWNGSLECLGRSLLPRCWTQRPIEGGFN